jgi:hypothetical protein
VSDYSDDALFITSEGVKRGKDGVRDGFWKLLADLPGATWELPTQLYEDDILLLGGSRSRRPRGSMTGLTPSSLAAG